MKDNMRRVILLGCGGHAKALYEVCLQQSLSVIGYVVPENIHGDNSKNNGVLHDLPYLGNDKWLMDNHEKFKNTALVNAVGSVAAYSARKNIFEKFKKAGFSFATITHPTAIISPSACLGEGCQIMAGAVIQTSCHIHDNCLINTKGQIDHDCIVHPHCHIAPGAVICGGVSINENCHIGAGAVIRESISIGKNVTVGAGAILLKNVADGLTLVGNPARIIRGG